ncbi:hypothetical protein [Maridesulfovibrio sp.]|uniref:hypothetical protein n=1 Tax=Maridesulfovibrio sp. TaxID=2795000 RepID=UPI003BAD8D5F
MNDGQDESIQIECGYTHEQYLEDRKTYLTGYQDQQTLFDKTLITLSAGAVGLIFTVTKGRIDHWSLKVSVIAFILALISSTTSFLFAAMAFKSFYKQFERKYAAQKKQKIKRSPRNIKSIFSTLGARTTDLSFLCAVVGVISLLIYFLDIPIRTYIPIYEL